jgi:KDO2-lipid IV(A) lauroyltransferase
VNLTLVAWRVVPRLPAPLARGLFRLAADVAWWRHGKGVRQLEANLARVRPELSPQALRRLSRLGMRRYLAYFCEAFQLARLSEAQVDQLVHFEGGEQAIEAMGPARQGVLVLGHMGNWDLAGAFATRHIAPVTTVAEHLEPEAVFQQYLAMRRRIGLTIIPLDKGAPVFRQVLRAAQTDEPWIIPLLADRDLGRSGIEVDWFGEKALMAPGPAALAVETGRPLFPVTIHREDKGYALVFHPPVSAPEGLDKAARVQHLTQAWANVLEREIRRHPADWHMLQKVFVADLDPARLAAVRGEGGAA